MRTKLKEVLFPRPFGRRLLLVLGGVFVMGFTLSLLVSINLGTDPCTGFGLSVSEKIHMSLGNWQVLFNTFLFLFVVKYNRRLIGFGTLANMILIGYTVDFFRYLWGIILPANFFEPMLTKIIILIPALLVFVFSAGCYIAGDLGVAPYDAIPCIIYEHQNKFTFRTIRMIFDITFMILGFLIGRQGGIVTIMMAFLVGPVIALVQKKVEGFLK